MGRKGDDCYYELVLEHNVIKEISSLWGFGNKSDWTVKRGGYFISHFQSLPSLMFVNMLIDMSSDSLFISTAKFYPIIKIFNISSIKAINSALLLNTFKPSMKKINLVTAFFYLQVV